MSVVYNRKNTPQVGDTIISAEVSFYIQYDKELDRWHFEHNVSLNLQFTNGGWLHSTLTINIYEFICEKLITEFSTYLTEDSPKNPNGDNNITYWWFNDVPLGFFNKVLDEAGVSDK